MNPEYQALDVPDRAQMIHDALRQLEATRFEAELNSKMSDDGDQVIVGPGETAAARIARIDRQLERLRFELNKLIGE
jgi:hypothetical protein